MSNLVLVEGVVELRKRLKVGWLIRKEIIVKRIIIIGIIISSIIVVGALIASPILIEYIVKSDSQWIAFYASYLGGIFGGIVSGSLTLGGVYLTIRHQNKLLSQEKFSKINYICRKLSKEFRNLNRTIEDSEYASVHDQVDKIRQHAEKILEIINDNNKYIMETDFFFVNQIESISDALKHITNYDPKISVYSALVDFENLNESIQFGFKMLLQYAKGFR